MGKMQYPDYLSQMAALVRENPPSITVREIAAKLQFADSKSVYYWLGKGNVSGINEFKRLVLAGGEDPRPPALGVGGTGTHYALTLPPLCLESATKKTLWVNGTFDTDPDHKVICFESGLE